MEDFQINQQEKDELLKIARKSIEDYLQNSKSQRVEEQKLSENLKKNVGAFVTLHNKGELRGCIGQFMPNQKLYSVVQEMAIAAATEDSRFLPVTYNEIKEIEIEISVLTPMQKIKSPEEIQVGRDGIYIRKGFYSGTFLPQVAIEQGWDRYEFLRYCSKHKAGLGDDGWKEAELFIYQAIVFSENNNL